MSIWPITNLKCTHCNLPCIALMKPSVLWHRFRTCVMICDAYYSVSVSPNHRKYHEFLWRDDLYQFTCLPVGLSSRPGIFTKIIKPVFAHFRSHECVVTKDIWQWAFVHHSWLSASFMLGNLNITADQLSRKFNTGTGWKLNHPIFLKIAKLFETPSMDFLPAAQTTSTTLKAAFHLRVFHIRAENFKCF